MQGKRADRVAVLIKEELGSLFTRGLKDPRIGFVTVTDVKVSDDLKYARVFYTVYGDERVREETAEALDAARGFLQRDIANALNLRYTPHLTFSLDSSLEEGNRIDGIIRKIREEESSKPGGG